MEDTNSRNEPPKTSSSSGVVTTNSLGGLNGLKKPS